MSTTEHSAVTNWHVLQPAALEWRDAVNLEEQVLQKEQNIRDFLETEIRPIHPSIDIRGTGMIWGIDVTRLPDQGNIPGNYEAVL